MWLHHCLVDGVLLMLDVDKINNKIEEYLITGMKYSFGLLVIGQTVMGIMSLV
jgi:hypothetical protein